MDTIGQPAKSYPIQTTSKVLQQPQEIHVMRVMGTLNARLVESGELVRFSYRVLDAEKAKILNDKQSEPALYGERAHVKLVVPQLEKVGKLRQSSTPVEGKTYWIAFSNKGGYIRHGDHISVVIDRFRASGLIVE